MGIFSVFNRGSSFNLTKSDFKTEIATYYDTENSPPMSAEFANELAEWKKKNGIEKTAHPKNESTTNITQVALLKRKVEISYDPTELVIKEKEFIAGINKKLNWISSNIKQINNLITSQLLDLKNTSWLDQGEKQFTESQFIKLIKLESIMFFSDFSCELVFDDGNIFGNHHIVVDLDKNNNLISADIQG